MLHCVVTLTPSCAAVMGVCICLIYPGGYSWWTFVVFKSCLIKSLQWIKWCVKVEIKLLVCVMKVCVREEVELIFSWCWHYVEEIIWFYATGAVLFCQWNSPWYPMYVKLDWPNSKCGYCGKRKICGYLFSCSPGYSVITIQNVPWMHFVTCIRIVAKNNVYYWERHRTDKAVKKDNFFQ